MEFSTLGFFVVVLFFWRQDLTVDGCLRTHYFDQVGLRLTESHPPLSPKGWDLPLEFWDEKLALPGLGST